MEAEGSVGQGPHQHEACHALGGRLHSVFWVSSVRGADGG